MLILQTGHLIQEFKLIDCLFWIPNREKNHFIMVLGMFQVAIDVSGPMNQLFVEANVSTSEGTIFKIPLSDK